VKVVFDNPKKILPVDFEEVSIERTVHRDGVNEYYVNGSQVRLKDIIEILASANIGSSGHHIISQGEADRILNTNSKERKSMLEDALGLKIFQYKRIESERKLTKTEENIAQVQSLRKEIAPHIKFLQKQVQKIEEGKKLKQELFSFYQEYLKRESVYLSTQKEKLSKNITGPQKRLKEIEEEIHRAREESKNTAGNELTDTVKNLESEFSQLTVSKEELLRESGRIEGQISSLTNILERSRSSEDENIVISTSELKTLRDEIKRISQDSEEVSDIGVLQDLIHQAIELVAGFLSNKNTDSSEDPNVVKEIEIQKNRLLEMQQKIEAYSQKESELREKINKIRQEIDLDKTNSLEAEKNIITLMAEKNELQIKISEHAVEIDLFNRDEASFKQELTESAVLVGREVLEYENLSFELEDRNAQLDRRKKLERMKIKVEEYGGGSDKDVMDEYKEVTERDEFLIKEIEDLEKSSSDLKELINDLSNKIETKFHDGVKKINIEFQKYFELMFGGGTAAINIIKIEKKKVCDTDVTMDIDIEDIENEENSGEEGVEISVNLPRKKIRDLMMLSGGERALTSIALLFAMSQVNPPPFIILDETDAALDESNSRKYGDMIENLSKESQLILITHNRETMSRAGVLYGITMTGGVSQLLSVQFDEGIQWAK
jgi:chromosome segregation protein